VRKVAWFLIASLAILNLALAIHDYAPAGTLFGPNKDLVKGLDLMMRRNEAQCVIDGVDPYLVWTQKIIREPYYPYVKTELRTERVCEPINAYTPWEYPFAMIWTLISKQTAWKCHFTIMLLAFAVIVFFSFRIGGPWAAVAALSFVIPANVDINVGNYALVIALAVLGILTSLERGWKCGAGFCWMIAMFKPQLALPMAVMLLLRKQWTVCFVAGGLCVLFMLPASILCGVSPVRLLCEAPAASAHAFEGCALMPRPLLEILTGLASQNVWMVCAMVVGLGVCVLLTCRVRACSRWIVLALPSLICSVSWTYVQPHSYVILIPVAAYFIYDMSRNPTIGRLCLGVPAIALMARFPRGVEIVVDRIFPSVSPIAHTITLLTATFAFAFSVVYVWLYLAEEEIKAQVPRPMSP